MAEPRGVRRALLSAHTQRGLRWLPSLSGASVRSENAATYSAGNKGQNFRGVFSETAPLQRSSAPSLDGHTLGRT